MIIHIKLFDLPSLKKKYFLHSAMKPKLYIRTKI